MDFSDSPTEALLRQQLRALIAESLPASFMGAFTDDPADLAVAQGFCRTLAARGLLTLAWPEEFGGGAGTAAEQTIVREEMWAHHEPRGAQYMNVNWIGPAIMRFGSESQQAVHLPPMAAGEVIWCQGFSEPDSGSDLASLKTAARPRGGGWQIDGQKIWTSYALMADWCFLLARTDPDAAKHRGISVFLVPMRSEGIEVRPIRTMLGPHHLNEVFFDSVAVGPDSLLGPLHDGWRIAREALAFERVGIARYARCDRLLNLARTVLAPRWHDLPESLRERWARALVHTRRARLLAYHAVESQTADRVDPRDAAAYRIAVTTLDQEVAEVLMDLVEEEALGPRSEVELFQRGVDDHWRYAQASTLASGSIEVQRILLSRSLLAGAPS